MIPEDIKARIDADMAAASTMDFRELLGFLDGYTARFEVEIAQGVVNRAQVRAYADEVLKEVLKP